MTSITVTPSHYVIVDLATGETTKYDNQQCSITITGANVTINQEPDAKTIKLNFVALIENNFRSRYRSNFVDVSQFDFRKIARGCNYVHPNRQDFCTSLRSAPI